jgi:hypothetical protein
MPPKELGEGSCIDGIGFDLCRADRLHTEGMSKLEVDVVRGKEVGEPVPAGGGLDDRARKREALT